MSAPSSPLHVGGDPNSLVGQITDCPEAMESLTEVIIPAFMEGLSCQNARLANTSSVHDVVNPGSQMGNQTADGQSDSNVSSRNTCHVLVSGNQASIESGNEASYGYGIEARVNSGRKATAVVLAMIPVDGPWAQGCTVVALMELFTISLGFQPVKALTQGYSTPIQIVNDTQACIDQRQLCCHNHSIPHPFLGEQVGIELNLLRKGREKQLPQLASPFPKAWKWTMGMMKRMQSILMCQTESMQSS